MFGICAGWLWEGEGGLGDHQPGVYVPLKALFLVNSGIEVQCVSVSEHVWVGAVGLGVGVGSYQPGVYVPLKTLILVRNKIKKWSQT